MMIVNCPRLFRRFLDQNSFTNDFYSFHIFIQMCDKKYAWILLESRSIKHGNNYDILYLSHFLEKVRLFFYISTQYS